MASGATSPLLGTQELDDAHAPAIGTLALVDVALRVAEAHLLAVHPTADPRHKRSYSEVLADALVGHLRATRAVLFAYREQTLAGIDPPPL